MMKKFSRCAIILIGLAAALPAKASTLSAIIADSLNSSFTGANLQSSIAFDLGSTTLLSKVSILGGAAKVVSVSLNYSDIVYGSGSNVAVPLATPLTKMFDYMGHAYTETLTEVIPFDRSAVGGGTLSLYLAGTLSGLGISPGTSVSFLISASQAGGLTAFSGSELSPAALPPPPPPVVPLPNTLVMFGTVIAGAGVFLHRRSSFTKRPGADI